jgi:hypothetical protein
MDLQRFWRRSASAKSTAAAAVSVTIEKGGHAKLEGLSLEDLTYIVNAANAWHDEMQNACAEPYASDPSGSEATKVWQQLWHERTRRLLNDLCFRLTQLSTLRLSARQEVDLSSRS